MVVSKEVMDLVELYRLSSKMWLQVNRLEGRVFAILLVFKWRCRSMMDKDGIWSAVLPRFRVMDLLGRFIRRMEYLSRWVQSTTGACRYLAWVIWDSDQILFKRIFMDDWRKGDWFIKWMGDEMKKDCNLHVF